MNIEELVHNYLKTGYGILDAESKVCQDIILLKIANSREMNEYIIQKWNSVVKKDDTVYHLGDVGFGSLEEVKGLIEKLNGTKILLRGNHDFKIGVNTWKEIGFIIYVCLVMLSITHQ